MSKCFPFSRVSQCSPVCFSLSWFVCVGGGGPYSPCSSLLPVFSTANSSTLQYFNPSFSNLQCQFIASALLISLPRCTNSLFPCALDHYPSARLAANPACPCQSPSLLCSPPSLSINPLKPHINLPCLCPALRSTLRQCNNYAVRSRFWHSSNTFSLILTVVIEVTLGVSDSRRTRRTVKKAMLQFEFKRFK